MQLRGIALLAVGLLAASAASAGTPQGFTLHVERTFQHLVDDRPATVTYDVAAASLQSPVRVTVVVRAGDDEVYRYEAGDDAIDRFFAQPNFVGWGATYAEGKLFWYGSEMVWTVHRLDMDTDPRMQDPKWAKPVYDAFKEVLKTEGGLGEDAARRVVERIAERMRTGRLEAIRPPFSPAVEGTPFVYVAEMRRFVPL